MFPPSTRSSAGRPAKPQLPSVVGVVHLVDDGVARDRARSASG